MVSIETFSLVKIKKKKNGNGNGKKKKKKGRKKKFFLIKKPKGSRSVKTGAAPPVLQLFEDIEKDEKRFQKNLRKQGGIL